MARSMARSIENGKKEVLMVKGGLLSNFFPTSFHGFLERSQGVFIHIYKDIINIIIIFILFTKVYPRAVWVRV